MSRMPFLSKGELFEVETSDPELKTVIGRYWGEAVNRLIGFGDTSGLDRYRGLSIEGHLFETDPDVIEDFILSTDFDFQELYKP
jgi:hypothetical protein